MTAIEIARKFAAFDQVADAQRAYTLALHQSDGTDPAGELEAALYLLQSGGDYKAAYTRFQDLYARGQLREEALDIMTQAFYAPNVKQLKARYEKNCKLLTKYPYLFRRDFPAFEELPLRFYPFDDNGYTPFIIAQERFGPYFNPREPVIRRNFFRDLENPVLAKDVFSQYELEYLNDSVRRSEWVGRENHIYLHYTSWGEFCAYLQVLNLRPLLAEKKFVFLMEDEVAMYPIDFQERFGLNYSQYPVKPFGVREINKLIWHTQLSAHNGGDFFNEIFFGHPNLLAYESLMFDNVVETMGEFKEKIDECRRQRRELIVNGDVFKAHILRELVRLDTCTLKDVFVAYFLSNQMFNEGLDLNARIAPALFFQPHFPSMEYAIQSNQAGQAILTAEQYEEIRQSPLFQGFKYIKTFTPMRRPTTSYGGTVRYMLTQVDLETGLATEPDEDGKFKHLRVPDAVTDKVVNRSFMIDWQDRLYQDSVLVRFEDGKLNPRATFTALAAFLDIPYTHSMTYCSGVSGVEPLSMEGNVRGFDLKSVYRTYDEHCTDAERCFIEYFLRDAYQYYGYEFQYYDGGPMDEGRVKELLRHFDYINHFIRCTARPMRAILMNAILLKDESQEERDKRIDAVVEQQMEALDESRMNVARALMGGLNFVNKNLQPLRMMTPLQLDPELLEAPLYH